METSSTAAAALSIRDRIESPVPGGRLLSNGRYSVLLTRSGTGHSRCDGYSLTRWNADRVEDRTGFFVFVRDLESGRYHSVGAEPAGGDFTGYEARWTSGAFSLGRTADGIAARMDVCVAASVNAEIRRVTLVNRAAHARRLDVTTCADIVLNQAAADASHPAFSKLFIQTEWVEASNALLARRRPRANDETHPWLVHVLLESGVTSCESDRVRFVGRGGSAACPRALSSTGPLSGTTGNVLDPVASLRRVLTLGANESVTLTFVLGVADDRDAALALVASLAQPGAVAHAFEDAARRERAVQLAAKLDEPEAEALQALGAAVLYAHPDLRAARAQLERNAPRAGLLADAGLRPGRPIVLAAVDDADTMAGLPAFARAAEYWRALGLDAECAAVFFNGLPAGSLPGIVVVHASNFSAADLDALACAAAAVVRLPLGRIAAETLAGEKAVVSSGISPSPSPNGHSGADPIAPEALEGFNGFGGFTADGREYVIRMPYEPGSGLRRPPLPWVNIMASERFGFFVSETGAGCTWNGNSREHRLSPWYNDPLLDPHGEALYLRDEESGVFWSPVAGPAPRNADYEMRHGFGYSVSRHASDRLEQEVCYFAHETLPVRITRVRVTNRGDRARRLTLWSYQRVVLGVLAEDSCRNVITEHDAVQRIQLARNPMAGEFSGSVAFAAAVAPEGAERRTCGDREAFLGVGGSAARPKALVEGRVVENTFGAGWDPCFAEQVMLEIAPGATAECSFLFGECASADEVRTVVEGLRATGAVESALTATRGFWNELVGGVQVKTPCPEIDRMVNGWLAYQTLSCRIWGRTAYYQSGGAFGFRDQLQDAASLLHLRPDLARTQIVLHAQHQFIEGDVLHWWHPPLSKGIRTRFADDLLWLPFLAAYYIQATGDWSVLDEEARFLKADRLADGEDEVFLVPEDSGQSADVYEHCCRALDRSLDVGEHGLPLFGTGDWNDGMNRVGREGRGESVWMGFFLHTILEDFIPVCERRGDQERCERYERHRDQLRVALNDAGWDGEWYRRAYYDNGAVLGSRDSDECRIDGLAQAWSVLSHAAPPERANQAMDSVEKYLISESDGLIRLLTPAFRDTPNDPGYIKGYVAGVRENGGQYTHGVLWVVRAMAELGRRDRAAKLLAMLSPVSHTATPEKVARYQTEPYVIVADVYGEAPHVGRGGWTWYTGSAGWMLRIALESVLGLTLVGGGTLRLKPCVPDEWPGFEISYRIPGSSTRYQIVVRNPSGCSKEVVSAQLDGVSVLPAAGCLEVPVLRDGRVHALEVVLGRGGA